MESFKSNPLQVGQLHIQILDTPGILSLRPSTEPERELIPAVFQPTERRWLKSMIQEVISARQLLLQGSLKFATVPDRKDLALPMPVQRHPIDHFGRAWNLFMQAAELMGVRPYFCNDRGLELLPSMAGIAPNASLCLRFV